MSIESLLKELGIGKIGEYTSKNIYKIEINSSDEWGKVFSLLDNSDLLESKDEYNLLNSDESYNVYSYENSYQLTLIADFINDIYNLVIEGK